MSIASRITDLVDTLATALNARNAPGASDYQMWLAAGNTGTIQDYRTAILGGDYDWATQFNNALGPIPASGAASETQAGVTQLASLSEAQAATIGTKALSPLQALALLRANPLHYPTLAALGAATPVEGAIATVDRFQYASGQVHAASTWRGANGFWYPVDNVMYVECTDRGALNSFGSAFYNDLTVSGGSKMRVPTGFRIRNTVATNGDELFFNGTFQLSNPQPLIATNSSSFSVSGGFTKLPISMPTGRDADWDSNANSYRAPRDGYYLFNCMVRFPDGFATGYNFGLSVVAGNEAQDTRTEWHGIPSSAGSSTNRYTHRVVRLMYLPAYTLVNAYAYFDSQTVTIGAGGAILEVLPVKE